MLTMDKAGLGQSHEVGKPGAQSRSPTWVAVTQLFESLALHSRVPISRKAGIRSQNQQSNPGLPMWDTGVLAGVLTAGPNFSLLLWNFLWSFCT